MGMRLEPKPDCVLVDGCNRPPELLRQGEQWTRGSRMQEMAKADTKQSRLSTFFSARKPEPKAARANAPWRPSRVESVINGDAEVLSISAASIIAKVHRDRLMSELHGKYPVYGFAEHKGYGTASHLEALKIHGPCPEHRRSFGPIKEDAEPTSAEGSGLLDALHALKSSESLTAAATPAKNIPAKRSSGKRLSDTVTTPAKETEASAGAAPPTKRGRKAVVAKTAETPVKNANPVGGVSVNANAGTVKLKPKPRNNRDKVIKAPGAVADT